ncbi:MAG: DNA polymerase III subunit delta' [Hyphomicrobiaceae bacterium]|nr:DNA polymerase III subunit delta' [Hyphomicrobiaceae bacterium]
MARAQKVTDADDVPEADRLEGFPHPREVMQLVGHQAAEQALGAALASGRLHHGWLLTGPDGIGKATLAYRFARAILHGEVARSGSGSSLNVPADSTAAVQIRALSHPGLLVIRRPWDPKNKRHIASIPVDEVRKLRGYLAHTAASEWRVVIVDSADELNVSAANAILKSLEEPPARTVFLLISSEPGRLLNTIRSRCRRLDLAALAPAELEAAARAAFAAAGRDPPPDAEWSRLATLSGGSVRRLVGLYSAGGLDLDSALDRLFAGLPGVDQPAAHALADKISPAAAEERFGLFFDLLLDRLARLVRARALGPRGDGQVDPADTELAARLIAEGELATWAALWETLTREKAETLALNLDRKALILDTLSRLEAVARRRP